MFKLRWLILFVSIVMLARPSFADDRVLIQGDTGTYRLEGDKWITKVEVAWNPDWLNPEKGMQRSTLVFERSK